MEDVLYTLKRSKRARYMRLRVHPGGAVVLTVPHTSPAYAVREFLMAEATWLKRAIARMMHYKALPVSGRRAYIKHREEARAFVVERVKYWNRGYEFPYGRIAIKNTRRTWGSCSRRGNLNFAYTLLFLPRALVDYVVVHELCHLRHPNHSRAFWAEVRKAMPDYEDRRRELKQYLPRN